MTATVTGISGDPTRVTGRRVLGGIGELIIDLLVYFSLVKLLGINLATLPEDEAAVLPPELEQKLGVLGVLGTVYLVLTKVLTLGMLGWTPGMLVVAVRCVRWNGKPPGVLRALWRTFFFNVWLMMAFVLMLFPFGFTGGMALIAGLILAMSMSKGHRSIHDMVAGTYCIDSIYLGRMILVQSDGVVAGPPAVTRDEAEKILKKDGAAAPLVFDNPQAKSGEPFLDKNLDTYVVWNAKQQAWLAFDKRSGAWNRIG